MTCAPRADDASCDGAGTALAGDLNAGHCATKGRPPPGSEQVPANVDSDKHRFCYLKGGPLNMGKMGSVETLTKKSLPPASQRRPRPRNLIRLACNFSQLLLRDEEIQIPEEVTEPFSDEEDLSTPSPLLSLHSLQNNEADRRLLEEYGNLQREFLLYNLSQVFPERLEDHILDVLSSDAYSIMEDCDKDSQKGMTSMSGVEARIHTFSGECLIVHDMRRATVGQVATGISNLIQIPSFSLVKQNGHPISPDFEIPDSGIDLRCTPASNYSNSWTWRVKDGNLNF
eukprot:g42375.t1